MRKVIKVIDDETIEISRYLSPEVRFFNPCTDIHNEYDRYESYCDFKDVINPFKMYAENKMLHSIIKEVRELVEQYSWNTYYYQCPSSRRYFKSEIISDLKQILDKVGDIK